MIPGICSSCGDDMLIQHPKEIVVRDECQTNDAIKDRNVIGLNVQIARFVDTAQASNRKSGLHNVRLMRDILDITRSRAKRNIHERPRTSKTI